MAKRRMTGYYTSSKVEGAVEITVPSHLSLPQKLKVNIKGEPGAVNFWLVKQKVVR